MAPLNDIKELFQTLLESTSEEIDNVSGPIEKRITYPTHLLAIVRNPSFFSEFSPLKKARTYALLHHYSELPDGREFANVNEQRLINKYTLFFDERKADGTPDYEGQLFMLLDLLYEGVLFSDENEQFFRFLVEKQAISNYDTSSLRIFASLLKEIIEAEKINLNFVKANSYLLFRKDRSKSLQSAFPLPHIYEMPELIAKVANLQLPEMKDILHALLNSWKKQITIEKDKSREAYEILHGKPLPNDISFAREEMVHALIVPIRMILDQDTFDDKKPFWIQKIIKFTQAWIILVNQLFSSTHALKIKEINHFSLLQIAKNSEGTDINLSEEVLSWEQTFDPFRLGANFSKLFLTDSFIATNFVQPINLAMKAHINPKPLPYSKKIGENRVRLLLYPLVNGLEIKLQLKKDSVGQFIPQALKKPKDFEKLKNMVKIWLVYMTLHQELFPQIDGKTN